MIFKTFDSSDIVAGRIQPVSTGMWSDGETEWLYFYTSSAQTADSASQYEPLNGLYYTNVYDGPTGSVDSDIYFSVTYGHYAGSGSSTFDTSTTNGSLLFPTKAIYNQYRNLLLTPGDVKFTFATASVGTNNGVIDSDDIYVINFKANKAKDRVDPGQFEITLSGSYQKLTLIDDSKDNPSTANSTGGRRYNLIRGTLDGGALISNNYEGFGSVYPDLGIVVLNPTKIAAFVGPVNGKALNDPTGSWGGQFAQMSELMYESIRGGAVLPSGSMKARVTEYVPARHFFVRVKNQEYNYSNNPTFVITSEDTTNTLDYGKLRFSDFATDPKVYITAIGLYNENNDLVAVAKLSQPALKDFTNELLIKIRLDF
jgi:hypothetical protein